MGQPIESLARFVAEPAMQRFEAGFLVIAGHHNRQAGAGQLAIGKRGSGKHGAQIGIRAQA